MRSLLALGLVACICTATSFAASQRTTISTSGVSLVVPAGWHARVSKTPQCDPERLIVASSAPLRTTAGRIAPAQRGQVIVLLLEDRIAQDRPVGDLRRPGHFTIDWSSLRILAPDGYCGNPRGPAAMHYVKIHDRYVGFIVYPGAHVSASTRAATLTLMDSLRVGARR